MKIPGYKELDYSEFQIPFNECFKLSGFTMVEVASHLNIKSIGTVQNVFNKKEQTASDEVITKVMGLLSFEGFILWHDGERKYFIK